MALGKKATVTTMSVIPWRRNSDTMCSIIGRPTSGNIGLGRFEVWGRSRVPSPPAMMTAFMRGSSSGPPSYRTALHAGLRLTAPPRRPAVAQRLPGGADVTPRVVPRQRETHDAGDPPDHLDRFLPRRVAVPQEEGRVGEHQAEGARLADPQ